FADVIPLDQPEIRIIIEYGLGFAGLGNRIYSSGVSSESVLNPRISRDELAVSVVKTRSNSVHLNPAFDLLGPRHDLSPSACLPRSRTLLSCQPTAFKTALSVQLWSLAECDPPNREVQS